MAKTRAEIQKAYRERKKQQNGEAYMAKERMRRKKNYIPSSELNRVQRAKRNLKNRENLLRHRLKKKRERANVAEDHDETDAEVANTSTSGYETEDHGNQLRVRLPLPNGRRTGPRKRRSRALANAYRVIQELKSKNDILSKKCGSLRKTLARKCKKVSAVGTPRSRTELQMRNARLTTKQKHRVRKHLLFGNVMLAEIATTQKKTQNSKRSVLHRIVSGKIVKKYRCLSMLSAVTGLCRRKLSKVSSKEIAWSRGTRKRVLLKYRAHVLQFLQRDDNSRAQPGKADAKISDGEKVQTRVLTDYISNLHLKYRAENPEINISLETFRRIRPKNILLTSFISRHSCLCTKHQNMALQLKTLRSIGVHVTANPESLLKEGLDMDAIRDELPEKIVQSQWRRVSVEEKGKVKNITRIVDTEVQKETYIENFKVQALEFKEHVSRVRTQYAEIKHLKENLPQHQMILHMDFAENYGCKTLDEIQSAYWNKVGVTLHPIVMYYRNDDGEVVHQSFVAVSDEPSHTASTVLTILKKVIPQIKALDEDVNMVHYWTDSPTSQYRNKLIFHVVANHEFEFGLKARWNYFEAGHGKGPCDGLGGVTKRKADESVRSGKCVIQDAQDFFRWAEDSSLKSVKFFFVPKEDCQETMNAVKNLSLNTVKGTMKIHAVVGLGKSAVAVRDVSCYCPVCLNGGLCESWRTESLSSGEQPSAGPPDTPQITVEQSENSGSDLAHDEDVPCESGNSGQMLFAVSEFVSAVYESKWYIGKVLDVDNSDNTVKISFMQNRKQLFQWPQRPDVIWCKCSDVLCKVDQPVPSGKSRRMFKLNVEDQNLVAVKFGHYK